MTENDELTAEEDASVAKACKWNLYTGTCSDKHINRERKHLGSGQLKLKIVLRRRQIQQGGEATGNL